MNMALKTETDIATNPFPELVPEASHNDKASAKAKRQRKSTKSKVEIVAFENSHSWVKRCDRYGTLTLQAGFVYNPPTGAAKTLIRKHKADGTRDDVLVWEKGQEARKRFYGEYACLNMKPERLDKVDKVDTARQSFAAMLRPSDDGKELVVVAAHWDEDKANEMGKRLMGQYSVTVNGDEINCEVVHVIPIQEGKGTWYKLHHDGVITTGNTLLYELGFGTTEKRLIPMDGMVLGHEPDESLSIKDLVSDIGRIPLIETAITRLQQQKSSQTILSRALRTHQLERLKSNWDDVVKASVVDWVKKLVNEVMNDDLASGAENWVLTGGGAELAKPYLEAAGVADNFIIPDDAQTASVRGAYLLGVDEVMSNAQ